MHEIAPVRGSTPATQSRQEKQEYRLALSLHIALMCPAARHGAGRNGKDNDMSKKSTKKTSSKTTTKTPAVAKTEQPAPPKKMGVLDAAAQVLAETGTAMNTAAMVKAMLDKGIWSTAGKTPAATLHAAISREVATKGDASRFRKVGRGMFALAK